MTGRAFRRLVVALAGLTFALLASAVSAAAAENAATRTIPPAASSQSASSSRSAAGVTSTPFYAYFYQWFTASSWNRAKEDYPAVGRYSSDDPHVLRDQVEQAKAAGLSGFLTSWKHTDSLDRRLDLLLRVAHDEQFDVGVVYEALDFDRNPLPIARVRSDLVYLVQHWGRELASRYYGRPVLIWTGTDQYSVADVRSVREALGSRAYLLSASKSIAGYERVAPYVAGEAYYWSSADPTSEATTAKLVNLGLAVHAHHGIWIAPATSGFDGRTLGHTRVIDRRDGLTLLRSLQDAIASHPDAVGLISWNEWSENTYIEPGRRYGKQELTVLSEFVQQLRQTPDGAVAGPETSGGGNSIFRWSGLQATIALAMVTTTSVLVLTLRARRRARFLMTGRHRRREI